MLVRGQIVFKENLVYEVFVAFKSHPFCPRLQQTNKSLIQAINNDLETIADWGHRNVVDFSVTKT